MSSGKPLLIENIEEELDPVLDPVLERRIIRKGKALTIALPDKEVSAGSLPEALLLALVLELELVHGLQGQSPHYCAA